MPLLPPFSAAPTTPIAGPIASPIGSTAGGTERPTSVRLGGGPIAQWTRNLVRLPSPLTTTQNGFPTNLSPTTSVGRSVVNPTPGSPILSGLQLGSTGATRNGLVAL